MFAKVFFGGSVVVLGVMYSAGMLGTGPGGVSGDEIAREAEGGWSPYCTQQVEKLRAIAEAHRQPNGQMREPSFSTGVKVAKIMNNFTDVGCDPNLAPPDVRASIGMSSGLASGDWAGDKVGDWGH